MVAMLRVCALLLAASAAAVGADFEILIRNARVVDGSGNPWFRADIGIRDGRIARHRESVGRPPPTASSTPTAASSRRASSTSTPTSKAHRRSPAATTSSSTASPPSSPATAAARARISAPGSRASRSRGIGINVASLIGHNTVRSDVMGTANRAGHPGRDREDAGRWSHKAMQDGAVGFSTGLIYIPGTYADTEEVVALAKVAAALRRRLCQPHARRGRPKSCEAIEEAVRVGREAGIRVELSHFKIDTRASGARATSRWRWSRATAAKASTSSSTNIPTITPAPISASRCPVGRWPTARRGQRTAGQPGDARAYRRRNADKLQKKRPAPITPTRPSRVSIRIRRSKAKRSPRSIWRRAVRRRSKTRSKPSSTWWRRAARRWSITPWATTTSTASCATRTLPSPVTAASATRPGQCPTRAPTAPMPACSPSIVRKRKVLTLEDAIRRMTSLPARTFGFNDRGLMREGMAADLVLSTPPACRTRPPTTSRTSTPRASTSSSSTATSRWKTAVQRVLAGRIVRHQP